MRPDDRRVDRSVSIQVNYITSLGITTILVVGLVMTTGSFVDNQRERAASHELEAIGNRIATQIGQADDLAARGGNVSVTISQPRRVVGESYSVRLEHGSACTSPVIGTDDCLVLRARQPGVTVKVPVVNTTNVEVVPAGPGTFRVTATPSDTTVSGAGSGATRNVDMTAGVGSDVSAGNGSDLNLANNQPVAKFTLDPGSPTNRTTVNFTSQSSDPDGAITKYEWDPNGDGTVEGTGRSFNYSYSSPGRYNATLTVTDDDGVEDSESKTVIVGGLVYEDDVTAKDYDGDGTSGGLTFNVTNVHDEEVELLEVYLDPHDDAIDELSSNEYDDEEGDRPIYLEPDGGGEHATDGGTIDILDDGAIVDLDEEGADTPGLDEDEELQIALSEFFAGGSQHDMFGEPLTVGLRYRIEDEDDYYVSKFDLWEAYNVPPTPEFDYTCTDRECEFDASASSDPDGSVTDYQWQFGDGDGDIGQTVDHNYTANGTYTATLVVTDDDGTSASVSESVSVGGVGVDLKVNFQPAGADEPPDSGYVVDSGGAYDDRNGETYGWMTDPAPSGSPTTVDETEHPNAHSDQRYDTLNRMEDTGNDRTWEAEVPDGRYRVYVAMGDPDPPVDNCHWFFGCSYEQPTNDVIIEGTTIDDPTSDDSNHDRYTAVVEVTDGRLSISPASGAEDPKLHFVEIESVDTQSFVEDSGQSGRVVLEAEHFQGYRQGDDDWGGDDMEGFAWWRIDDDPDTSNGRALEVVPDDGEEAEDTENGPRLDYEVDFDTTGEYYVWARMNCPSGGADSVHVGLDGTRASDDAGLTDGCSSTGGWTWVNRADGDFVTVDVSSTGAHTVNVWANKDGTRIDKIVLTTEDPGDWDPGDDSEGPPESDRS